MASRPVLLVHRQEWTSVPVSPSLAPVPDPPGAVASPPFIGAPPECRTRFRTSLRAARIEALWDVSPRYAGRCNEGKRNPGNRRVWTRSPLDRPNGARYIMYCVLVPVMVRIGRGKKAKCDETTTMPRGCCGSACAEFCRERVGASASRNDGVLPGRGGHRELDH